MIGFFRRIRKKLADDNQFLKYSRYAIGEIVLVMVGILLALQVNNWNEKRKQSIKTQFYLKSLISDNVENRDYLIERNKILREELEVIDSISNKLSSNHANIDTLILLAREKVSLMYHGYPQLNENTFNTLQSTGHFEYFEPWLQEYLLELNFLQKDLYSVSKSLKTDFSTALTNFLTVFPRNNMASIISDSLAKEVDKATTNADRISAINNLIWIKGGAYFSLLRRAVPLEEKTSKLVDTLAQIYPELVIK